MKKSIAVLVVSLLISVPLSAHAFPTKKGDKACTECHKLSKQEAEEIVKKIAPNGKVTDVKVAPLTTVWQIEVDAGEGKHGTLYLDFSKKFLIAGQIVPVESIGKQPPPRKVDFSRIPLGDAITEGAATAKKKVIVFTDPDCPYCREFHKIMKQVVAKRSDISFSVVLIPLPMHKDAPKKVQTILCTKSLEILDDAFAGKTVPEPAATCTADAVERNKALAASLEVNGTPTLIRDDGTVLPGFLPEEQLMDWIDKKQ